MMTEAIPIANAKVRTHFRKECGCMLKASITRSSAWSAPFESRRPRKEKIHHDRTNHMEVHCSLFHGVCLTCMGVTSWRTKALTDLSQVPMVVREPSKQNLLHNIFMYIARDNTFSLSKLICNDFNRPYTMVIARARHADKPRTCKD